MMMTPQSPMETLPLEARIERVEKENRRLRVLVAMMLLLCGTVLLLAATPRSAPRTLEVEKIVIKDRNGKSRGVLGVVGLGPTLAFYDDKNQPRFAVGVTEEGPEFVLYDAKHNKRIEMEVSDKETALDLSDHRGKRRLSLGMGGEGDPGLFRFDEEGKIIRPAQ